MGVSGEEEEKDYEKEMGGGYLVGNDDGHDHVFEVREELQEQELEGWVQNKNYY